MNSNRMGLGLRPPGIGAYPPSTHGQGPPLSALSSMHGGQFGAPQQAQQPPPSTGPKLTAFVGSISPGITDNFLTQLLSVSVFLMHVIERPDSITSSQACGPLRSFKRTPTATGKPGAFGFAEFDEPDAISRALKLLDGLTLPALEDGSGPPKSLKLTADAKTKALLEAYDSQKMETDVCSILWQPIPMMVFVDTRGFLIGRHQRHGRVATANQRPHCGSQER